MRALEYVRSIPRFLAVRALAPWLPSVATGPLSCLRLVERQPLPLPGPGWLRVRTRLSGICGSDLGTITCQGSYYFSALTSFPFIPGHEIVGEVVEVESGVAAVRSGQRVVVEPALGCQVRGIAPACSACQEGNQGNCVNVACGHLAAGLQTGYCRDTGGGWGETMVVHESQVHLVPDAMSDEDAVLIEPFACAVHAVLTAFPEDRSATVLVLGAGSVGLLTLLALRSFVPSATVLVAAKHPHQAALASDLGAAEVLPTGRALLDPIVRRTGANRHQPEIGPSVVLGGVDTTFDCIGSSRTIDEAVRLTRARGTVVLVGMPGVLTRIEGTAMWYKETRCVGAYAYGSERTRGREARTFTLALEAATRQPGTLARLITGRYGIGAYRQAIRAALQTGPGRSVKTVFDHHAPRM